MRPNINLPAEGTSRGTVAGFVYAILCYAAFQATFAYFILFLNGVLAAKPGGYTTDYTTIPLRRAVRAALEPGKNVIAIHCKQTRGGQYIDAGLVKIIERNR